MGEVLMKVSREEKEVLLVEMTTRMEVSMKRDKEGKVVRLEEMMKETMVVKEEKGAPLLEMTTKMEVSMVVEMVEMEVHSEEKGGWDDSTVATIKVEIAEVQSTKQQSRTSECYYCS